VGKRAKREGQKCTKIGEKSTFENVSIAPLAAVLKVF
jgi:hypothetical protein